MGRWNGVPLFMHWATPLGLWAFSGFRFSVVAMLAMAFVVLVHELGHALVVQRVGGRATRVEILPMGGLCHWTGHVSPLGRALIAWGGVLGQLVLLLVTVAVMKLSPVPKTPLMLEVAEMFVVRSAWMMALNLLPVAPLDGKEAWSLFPRIYDWFRARRRRIRFRRRAQIAQQLRELNVVEELPVDPKTAAFAQELAARALADAKQKKWKN
jgi:Zn-dependent protease